MLLTLFLFYILNIANLLLVWNLSFLVFHLLSWDPVGFSISPIYLGLAEWFVESYFPVRDQTYLNNESMES